MSVASEARWAKILNVLYLQKNILDEELKTYVGSTLSTIKTDIAQLNNHLEGIAIIHGDSKSYSLEVLDKSKFQGIMTGGLKESLDFNFSHKRISFIIYYLLNSESFVKIDELSDEMNISRSTLNNDIKKTREILKKYNVEIKGVPNKGLIIQGDEFNLRLVNLYLVFDYYSSYIQFSQRVTSLLDQLAEYYQLDFQYQNMLCKVVSITIGRLLAGKKLENPIVLYQNHEKDNGMLKELFASLEAEFSVVLSPLERDFIAFPINTRNSHSIKGNQDQNYPREIRIIFDEMIEKVEKAYLIKIDSNLFFEDIKNHLMTLINRLVFRLPLNDFFFCPDQNKFPPGL